MSSLARSSFASSSCDSDLFIVSFTTEEVAALGSVAVFLYFLNLALLAMIEILFNILVVLASSTVIVLASLGMLIPAPIYCC